MYTLYDYNYRIHHYLGKGTAGTDALVEAPKLYDMSYYSTCTSVHLATLVQKVGNDRLRTLLKRRPKVQLLMAAACNS